MGFSVGPFVLRSASERVNETFRIRLLDAKGAKNAKVTKN